MMYVYATHLFRRHNMELAKKIRKFYLGKHLFSYGRRESRPSTVGQRVEMK